MASDPVFDSKRDFPPPVNDPGLDIPDYPGAGDAEGGDVQGLRTRIAELEAEKANLNDRLLRALAETQNVRKRGQREVEDAGKYAVTKFARDMLSAADNLERALQAVPADRDSLDPAIRNTIVGIEATARELAAIFERHGIKRIEALDVPFDPELHQAMMEVESTGKAGGTVVQELMPGYTLQGRLLRAAMVAVAKS